MIRTEGLSKVYPDGTKALDGVSLNIDSRFTAIIGRNGAGKTTLVRILSTQLEPSSGRAFIDDLDVIKNADRIRKKVVSIPQEASPIGILTPFEQVKLYLIARGMTSSESSLAAKKSLEDVGLSDSLDKPTDMLSGGTKRKVFVAMALASNAEIVFLDEPTTGLDPISRLEVWAAVRKLDGKIILTTHYMEEAENLSKDVIMIDSGTILERGSVAELLNRFKGRVRIESLNVIEDAFKVGDLYIKYVNEKEAAEFINKGVTIRRISLDDLFVIRGVTVEH
ncbi:MAG: ABC transporter ATP-binding protein [Nitrososphaerota archaeon]|jgi:ABC-2 type transport system ATP-binding protein|nr:ABC transporter ATP-binding protein [Nitrososphaerota archaeon]MDG7036499.1 ABC transporter ATP-binding protein [Nitrososphaerota archaeon]MDG7038522.1 ABC transporter ATP-binding protein [Nitrososphaerota archaeon]